MNIPTPLSSRCILPASPQQPSDPPQPYCVLQQALEDFRERIAKYEEVYETITDRNLHYIKLIDMCAAVFAMRMCLHEAPPHIDHCAEPRLSAK